MLWTSHLWSYRACPEPKRLVELEREYRLIAAATQRKLEETRGYLRKAVRS